MYDAIDVRSIIHHHTEQNGLAPKDVVPHIGGCNRVQEVLHRKRPPSPKMIWRLHQGLGIPAESLIKADHEATRVSAAPRTDLPDTHSLGTDRQSAAVNDKELG